MQFNFDKEEIILHAIQKLCFYMGFLYDNNSWASIFLVLKAVIMVLLSFLHFSLAIILDSEKVGRLSLMEIFHYSTVEGYSLLVVLSFLYKSKQIKLFRQALSEEIKQRKMILTPSQEKITIDVNRFLEIFWKYAYGFIIVVGFLTLVRRPLFDRGSAMATCYEGWLWFEVDTWPKWAGVAIFHVLIATHTVHIQYLAMISLTTHVKYLGSLCEILTVYIKDSFERNFYDELNSSYKKYISREKFIKMRVSKIIQQHQRLLSLIDMFKDLYNVFLLSVALVTGLVICTLIYIVTDPNSSTTLIIQCTSLLAVEGTYVSIYCWVGQQLTDNCAVIRNAIFDIAWYDLPISEQKSLLNIMIACTKDQVLMAGGLQEFSMRGLSESSVNIWPSRFLSNKRKKLCYYFLDSKFGKLDISGDKLNRKKSRKRNRFAEV